MHGTSGGANDYETAGMEVDDDREFLGGRRDGAVEAEEGGGGGVERDVFRECELGIGGELGFGR